MTFENPVIEYLDVIQIRNKVARVLFNLLAIEQYSEFRELHQFVSAPERRSMFETEMTQQLAQQFTARNAGQIVRHVEALEALPSMAPFIAPALNLALLEQTNKDWSPYTDTRGKAENILTALCQKPDYLQRILPSTLLTFACKSVAESKYQDHGFAILTQAATIDRSVAASIYQGVNAGCAILKESYVGFDRDSKLARCETLRETINAIHQEQIRESLMVSADCDNALETSGTDQLLPRVAKQQSGRLGHLRSLGG